MKLQIHAVGRMKSGPERELVDRYLDRADKTGRSMGLNMLPVRELNESRATQSQTRKEEEARELMTAFADGGVVIVLDERGKSQSSEAFAQLISSHRDRSCPAMHFVIGGADGHGAALQERADVLLSFGAMTWPHQIVRVLMAEQIYRAMTILSGHPYHRV